MNALTFVVALALGIVIIVLGLSFLDRLMARWRLGFLVIFPVGSVLAFVVAATSAYVAGSEDRAYVTAFVAAQAVVAMVFIRAAMRSGRRWKS